MIPDFTRSIAFADMVDNNTICYRTDALRVVLRLLLTRRFDTYDVLLRSPVLIVLTRNWCVIITDLSSDKRKKDNAAVHAVYGLTLPSVELGLVEPRRDCRMFLMSRKRMIELRTLFEIWKEIAAECYCLS